MVGAAAGFTDPSVRLNMNKTSNGAKGGTQSPLDWGSSSHGSCDDQEWRS
jgi:hypothetical protein